MFMVIKYGEDLGYMYYAIGPFPTEEAAKQWAKEDFDLTTKEGEWETFDSMGTELRAKTAGCRFEWHVVPIENPAIATMKTKAEFGN